jgi:LuxR family maltose regulon positive regulatory protein
MSSTQSRAAEQYSPRRAKLRPPRLPGDVVVRPRLVGRLNRLAALALIVAPAGYGKTTLVGSWLAQVQIPAAWLSLDEEDNDSFVFMAAVITAVQSIFPDFGAGILATLNAPHIGAFSELAVALCNELNTLTDEFALVLEDYHAIHEPRIHELLLNLVTYPPQAMRLVITTRHDPPLPWRTRIRGDLCELRAADLSFTEEEAGQFLTNATDQPVSDTEVRMLVEQSQGWVISLRLATLAVRRQRTGTNWANVLSTDVRNFDDYFNAEVLARLQPDVLTFLLRTSILELVSGQLCDFVTGEETSTSADGVTLQQGRGATLLREFERAGAFTVALDDQGIWYRYHPLLRGVLRRQLEQAATHDEIAGLYLRAAHWHEEHHYLDEALLYFLGSGQLQHALAFVQRWRHQLLDNFEWRRLEQWLQQFPPSVVAQHIELTIARMWINFWRYNMPDNILELARVERMLAELPPDTLGLLGYRGEIASFRCQQYTYTGDTQDGLAAADEALANVSPHRFYVRSTTMAHWAMASQMAGQWQQAWDGISELEHDPYTPRDLAKARTLQLLAHINLPATNLDDTQQQMPQMLQLTMARKFRTSMAWAQYYWGCACYLQDDLDAAEKHFRSAIELADYAHAISYAYSAIGLAQVCQSQGREMEATDIVDEVRRVLLRRQQSFILTVVNTFSAELAASQGRVEEALRWVARESRQSVFNAFPAVHYHPMLGFVRVLLAGGTADNLREAQVWLQRQTELAVRIHNTLAQIQSATLEAALYDAQGNRARALTALQLALTLAEHGTVLRPFVDLAPQLAPLLEELDQVTLVAPAAEFAARVRTAVSFEQDSLARRRPERPVLSATGDRPAAARPGANTLAAGYNGGQGPAGHDTQYDLSTLLTYRETDVLRLLEQRLTNKEIAHKLGITTETVRQHTVNLFRKLGVKNRRQAVATAYRLHFFDARP